MHKDRKQGLIQQSVSKVLQAAQQRFQKPVQNFMNSTTLVPGQKKSFNQIGQDIQKNPSNYIFSSAASQGKLGLGNKQFNDYIAKPTGQALNSFISTSTVGLVNPYSAKAKTAPEMVGQGVGFAAGMINPYNVGGKVLAPVGSAVEKAAGKLLVKGAVKKAPQLLRKGAQILAGEAAQTGVLSAGNIATGQEFDPLGDLASGVGLRGAGRTLGKLAVLRRPHYQDAEILDQASEILRSKKPGNKDLVRALKDVDNLMEGYLKERMPKAKYAALQKAPMNRKLAELQVFFKGADKPYPRIETGTVTMGLVGKNTNTPRTSPDALGGLNQPKGTVKPLRVSKKVSNIAQKIVSELEPGNAQTGQSLGGKPLSTANVPPTGGALPPTGGQGKGSKSLGDIISNPQDPYFNINRLNIPTDKKAVVKQTVEEVKPTIEKFVGKKLSNKEAIDRAQVTARTLNTAVEREKTLQWEAALLKTRQKLAYMADNGTVDQDYIDTLVTLKTNATDIGRKLQSFGIGADPETTTAKQMIMESVLKVEKDTAKILEAAKGVDFNDMNQATRFYRQFVKPTKSDWLDLLRYNSMLSSPNTHINNAASNFLNSAIVAPAEKSLTGVLDFLSSKATGKGQTQFAGEGAAYAAGYAKSWNTAAHKFADTLRGKTFSGNLDARQIPLATEGASGKIYSKLSVPTRLLEATDQFFTELVKGGETAALTLRNKKLNKTGDVSSQALKNARYRLFRQELFDKDQGVVLDGIDRVTNLIQQARNNSNPIVSNIAKYTLPFVQTPMNIFKQGVEYSPVGMATVWGAKNKTQQISKSLLGTGALGVALLVTNGRTTWAEPTDEKKKQAFRAAGMQPYSVKIGDNWVSYAKLPPALGFNLAFVSAIHDAQENRLLTDKETDVLMNAAAKYMNFYADQSYVKNIGDLVASAKGDVEGVSRFVSNYPQQLVPYRALLGWMARLVDPYQRQTNKDANFLDKQVQELSKQIPFLSMTVPARQDEFGEPIKAQNKELNAFSPFRVTTEDPARREIYDLYRQETNMRRSENKINDLYEKGITPEINQAQAAEETPVKNDPIAAMRAKSMEKIAKLKVKNTGERQIVQSDVIYQNENGEASVFDMSKSREIAAMPDDNRYNKAIKESKAYAHAQKILELPDKALSEKEKLSLIEKMGITADDVKYLQVANDNTNLKTLYVLDNINVQNREQMWSQLIKLRREVNGKQVLSSEVIDNLVDEGLLSKYEAKQLKAVKLDRNGKQMAQVRRSGGGGRKRALPKVALAKPIKIRTRKVGLKKIRLGSKSEKKKGLQIARQ